MLYTPLHLFLSFIYRPQLEPRIHFEEALSTAALVFWQHHISESACHYSSIVMQSFANDLLIALKTKMSPALSQVRMRFYKIILGTAQLRLRTLAL